MSEDTRKGQGKAGETPAESDLSARLKALDAKLDGRGASAPRRAEPTGGKVSGGPALANAFRMSTEFVAGVIAGGLIGWLVDRLLGTNPWGLIVFLMLGFAAGVFNVVRASGAAGKPPGKGGPADGPPI